MDAERVGTALPRPVGAWARFALTFFATFVGGLALILVFLILVDPVDSGRFPKLTANGPIGWDGRVADISRGRDPHYDAAIIGNSHLLLLDPARLSAASGLSFVQLAVQAERKREDAAVISWFRRNHRKISALVVNADSTICDRDPALPLVTPFPFWLYGSNLDYVAHLLSLSMLDYASKRIRASFGRARLQDPRGPHVVAKMLAFAGPPPNVEPPPTDLTPAALDDGDFPAIRLIEQALDGLAPSTLVIFVIPPEHISVLPTQGSEGWRETKSCKYALQQRVAAHANWRYLDYLLDTPDARDAANFVDNNHYRAPLARKIERDIASLLTARHSAALHARPLPGGAGPT